MYLPSYLTLLTDAEHSLANSYHQVAAGHAAVADVVYTCAAFARQCEDHATALEPIRDRYPAGAGSEPDRLDAARTGPIGLLRDLTDLYQLASLVELTWELAGQAAYGARDRPLIGLVADCGPEITAQVAWLRMRTKAEASQTLLVAP